MSTTYADVARPLLRSGLGSPLPLPPNKKTPPPERWTGKDAPYASGPDVEAWIEAHPGGNAGLRLDEQIIGLDVDAYDGKQGAQTMHRLIGELGPLPKTVVITSRGFMRTGDPSGIRLYRVPPGISATLGDLGGNVEVLRAQHRYAVVAGIHPDTGAPYLWYDGATGEQLSQIPSIDQIPYLPQPWLDRLRAAPRANATEIPTAPGVPFEQLSQAQRDDVQAYLQAFARSEGDLFAQAANWPEGMTDSHGRGWQKMVADLAYRLGAFLRAPWAPVTEDDCKGLMRQIVPPVIAAAVSLEQEWARQGGRAEPAPMPAPRVSLDDMAGGSAPGPTLVDVREDVPGGSGAGDVHSGQVRMAHRLAATYRGRLLFVHGIGWHYYDGTRWAEDLTGHARRAVIDVLEQGLIASIAEPDLRKDVEKCESAAGISGVLQIAAALVEFATTTDTLDQEPALLNVQNGTLDLRTMELRPHDPADRLTKITRAAYQPGLRSEEWEAFLTQILPDADERAYLQRVIGQALYGQVEEHILPLLIGEGGNGKGVTYEAVLHAVGSYGANVAPEMLLVRDSRSVPTELMDLRGARLVVASETNRESRFDEATMKRLTGGDPITARRLFRDPVTFTPSHTLLYITNNRPQVSADAPAVWRRLRVVPFDVKIPEERQDRQLGERLRGQADAILTWMLEGYVDYRRGGIATPDRVRVATEAYQESVDPVKRFIGEACFVSPHASARTRELYSAWQKWALADDAPAISEKAFSKELTRLGYASRSTNIGKVWSGLMPVSQDEE